MPCKQSNAPDAVLAGADLSASSFTGSPPGSSLCTFKALSVESQTRIDQTLQLDVFGTFALKIMCNGSANDTLVSNVITVACGADLRLSGGRCRQTTITCGPDEVRIGKHCKQAPHLRTLSDAQAIFVTVPNAAVRAGSVRNLPVQLVLDGGFGVEWSMGVSGSRIGAPEWLAIQPVAEHVLTPAHAVSATLELNVSEQEDFSLSGDLRRTLAIESLIPSKPGVVFEGQSIEIPVRARVSAQACVVLQDVQIETDAGGRRDIGDGARVEGVEPKSSVIVFVRAYDCRRSPIQRYLDDYPLHVRLNDSGSALVMEYAPTAAEKNLYRLMLPPEWVNSTGDVQLVVFTNVTIPGVVSTHSISVTLVLASNPTTPFPVSTVVGVVIGVGLFVLLLCLLGVLRKNRAAVKETIKAYMKFELRLGMEISMP